MIAVGTCANMFLDAWAALGKVRRWASGQGEREMAKATKKTGKPARKAKSKGKTRKPLFPGFFKEKLAKTDPKVAKAIAAELSRQQNEIELIASENIVSRAVLEAQGSVLTNKYAEGYPGRRYYGGCQYVDQDRKSVV